MKDRQALTGIGIMLAAMLATVGCSETVVVTATPTVTTLPTVTPTAVPTLTAIPTPTPVPTATAVPTPDLRAACNKKIAGVFRVLLIWVGDGWLDFVMQDAPLEKQELAWDALAELLTDEQSALLGKWGIEALDFNEDSLVRDRTTQPYWPLIEDLEDGKC